MKFPSINVEGKVALITGGTKGVGLAMAKALAYAGAEVALVSRNLKEGKLAAKEFDVYDKKAVAFQCDVTKKEQVEQMVGDVASIFGRIDILINNAGMNRRHLMVDYPEAEWDQVIDTNLKGIFLVSQAVGKVMISQKRGKIINISSILGTIGMTHQIAYASSKGGINQLTKVLALELAPYNIQVNALSPTYIRTPMTEDWLSDQERFAWILSNTPAGRVGELEDLYGPVVFLASDASDMITGQILHVDGGWVAH